jgi:hypothetical protein|tara:strand:- start:426 stop:560 length:135 start_codon:yes stop_codon:yes gene_type:complete
LIGLLLALRLENHGYFSELIVSFNAEITDGKQKLFQLKKISIEL